MDNLLSKALLLFITASILLPLSSRACLLGTITYRGWIGINKSITSKTIIHVPQDYQSIQKAIDHATPGTTIVIDSGIYYEAVHIADKQDITIIGNGVVVIDTQKKAVHGMFIVCSRNITIRNIVIQNGKFSGVRIDKSTNITIIDSIIQRNGNIGILMINSTNVDLVNCTIQKSDELEVSIIESDNINIINCLIQNSGTFGIAVSWSKNIGIINCTIRNNKYNGIEIFNSSNIIVRSCIIQNNNDYGIAISHSNNTYIGGCIIQNNKGGIQVAGGLMFEITRCIIRSNSDYRNYGVCIYGLKNVFVYLNYINDTVYISNGARLFSPEKLHYLYNNSLYYSYLGNYWRGYSGVDSNGDGIGETPHRVSYGVDKYPLIEPPSSYTILPDPITIVKPENNSYVSNRIDIVLDVVTPLDLVVSIVNNAYVETIASYRNITGSYTITLDTTKYVDGLYRLYFNYTILEYNKSFYKELYITIDNTPPIIIINNPRNNTIVYSGVLEITWTIKEQNLEKLVLYIDNKPVDVTGIKGYAIAVERLSIGLHNITLYAVDKSGHTNTTTVFIERQTPTTTPTTTETTETPSTPVPSPTLVVIVVVIAIVVVAVIMVFKKRH